MGLPWGQSVWIWPLIIFEMSAGPGVTVIKWVIRSLSERLAVCKIVSFLIINWLVPSKHQHIYSQRKPQVVEDLCLFSVAPLVASPTHHLEITLRPCVCCKCAPPRHQIHTLTLSVGLYCLLHYQREIRSEHCDKADESACSSTCSQLITPIMYK